MVEYGRIIDLVRWPACVTITGVVLLLTQREAVADVLRRLRRASAGGFNFAPPTRVQVASIAGPSRVTSTDVADLTRDLGMLVDPHLIDMRANTIYAEFDSRDIPHGTREPALVALLSAALIREFFEQLNFAIYGSQLKLLQLLNENMVTAEAAVRAIYDAAAEALPEPFASFPFDLWISFLQGTSLIEISEAGYRITWQGRGFLKYLIARGYPLARAG